MKNINIILHYPTNERVIQNATNEFYLMGIKKVLNKSTLSIQNKKEILDNIIKNYKGDYKVFNLFGQIKETKKEIDSIKNKGSEERKQIREESKARITAIERDTKEYEIKLDEVSAKRKALVDRVTDILKNDSKSDNDIKEAMNLLKELDSNPEYKIPGTQF